MIEGTWVVTSHEDDDEKTTDRMRDLHRRASKVVFKAAKSNISRITEDPHTVQVKSSYVKHLKRVLHSIDIRPFMLRGK